MVHEDEDEGTLKVGSRGKSWDVRSLSRSIFCAVAFAGLGEGFSERKRPSAKGWEAGGGMGSSTKGKACLRAGNVTECSVISSALHWMGVSSGLGNTKKEY